MLLDPPGWPGLPEALPHWPYVQALDRALSDHGIPPGIGRANRTGREHGETMYMVLVWDVSRTGALGGVRLDWGEETGWAYGKLGVSWQEADWASDRLGIQSRDAIVQEPFSALRRVFAAPGDVADAAEPLVCHWRLPGGEYAGEWDQAGHVRAVIDAFRRRPVERHARRIWSRAVQRQRGPGVTRTARLRRLRPLTALPAR